jgi:mercuric ion transport protein
VGKNPGKASLSVTSVGGLVTAFLASICCIGPVVFAALSVGAGATGFLAGTVGFLKALLPYRPVFIGLTMLLLGISFYQAYRRPTSAVCVPGEVCAPGATSGPGWTLLWTLAILAVVLLLAPYWLGLSGGIIFTLSPCGRGQGEGWIRWREREEIGNVETHSDDDPGRYNDAGSGRTPGICG